MRGMLPRLGNTLCGAALLLVGLVSSPAPANAQAWPSRSVRIVVPFSVGGTTDLLARVLGQALSESTGQTFIVENKTGAGGTIGAGEVARSAPDGYTLMLTTSSTHSIAPTVVKLPYDTVKDFTPLVHLADSNMMMLGSPTLGAKTVKDLLDLARAKPGTINYSSSGVGTLAHLVFELFASQTGIVINHVPYRGTGSVMQDLTAGHVHLALDAVATGIPHVKSGRATGLGLTGPAPAGSEYESIEKTAPGFSAVIWFGIYGPGSMSADLADQINTAFRKVMASPQLVERYKTMGLEPKPISAPEFGAMVAKDRAKWQDLATKRNIRVE